MYKTFVHGDRRNCETTTHLLMSFNLLTQLFLVLPTVIIATCVHVFVGFPLFFYYYSVMLSFWLWVIKWSYVMYRVFKILMPCLMVKSLRITSTLELNSFFLVKYLINGRSIMSVRTKNHLKQSFGLEDLVL